MKSPLKKTYAKILEQIDVQKVTDELSDDIFNMILNIQCDKYKSRILAGHIINLILTIQIDEMRKTVQTLDERTELLKKLIK